MRKFVASASNSQFTSQAHWLLIKNHSFVQSLRSLASIFQTMPLCKACNGITVETLDGGTWYHHLPDACALETFAKTCPLYEVILLSKLDQTISSSDRSLQAGPIKSCLDFPADLEHKNMITILVQFPDTAVCLDIFRESGNLLASSFDNCSTSRLMYTKPFFEHLGG